jgi:hypothetical protein
MSPITEQLSFGFKARADLMRRLALRHFACVGHAIVAERRWTEPQACEDAIGVRHGM